MKIINSMYLVFIGIISVTSCTQSAQNVPSEKIKVNYVITPCIFTSEMYGTVTCNATPLSINQNISESFKRNCDVNLSDLNSKDIKCLKENINNPADQYTLGYLTFWGDHVVQDKIKALQLIKLSAEKLYPEALIWLAQYYRNKKDDKLSFQLTNKAAELGSPQAMYNLGYYYNRGIGVENNKKLALEWLEKSIPYVGASYSEIGAIYLVDKDIENFIKYNDLAIKNDFPLASAELSLLYLGSIPDFENFKNLDTAKYYIDTLIENDIAVGYYLKAKLMLSNNEDKSKICNLYEKSYSKGYIVAGINLAAEYLNGETCMINYSKALGILNQLYKDTDGEKKSIVANNLGYIYLNGLGVKTDDVKAKRYFIEASNLGSIDAQTILKQLN